MVRIQVGYFLLLEVSFIWLLCAAVAFPLLALTYHASSLARDARDEVSEFIRLWVRLHGIRIDEEVRRLLVHQSTGSRPGWCPSSGGGFTWASPEDCISVF